MSIVIYALEYIMSSYGCQLVSWMKARYVKGKWIEYCNGLGHGSITGPRMIYAVTMLMRRSMDPYAMCRDTLVSHYFHMKSIYMNMFLTEAITVR